MNLRWAGRMRWLALALAIPAAAQAQIDLTALDREMTGPRTRVLVLGTVHLSRMPKTFKAESLDPLLDKLAAFSPDIITIEAISGEQCDLAARHPGVYGADYCADTHAAKAATGLEVPAAIAEIDKTLAGWPAHPTPAQRRHLAALFLAANERASAYVQWLQLPVAERRAGDGLDAALATMLEQIAARNNENYQIAARLAARLGLQRVYAVDDHTGDNLRIADAEAKAFGQEIEQAWKAGRAGLDRAEALEQRLSEQADLLPLYRYLNSPDNLRLRAEVNVAAALRAKSARHYPQIWVGGWEIRNLRMVANIRQTFRERPGVRVLSVVGSSHKPWFDAWLGQMSGVEIVDAERALK